MALARLIQGPLDGQVIPIGDDADDSLIVPYGEGQLVYERRGEPENTGDHDGPTQSTYVFVETTEDIDPDPDGRDE